MATLRVSLISGALCGLLAILIQLQYPSIPQSFQRAVITSLDRASRASRALHAPAPSSTHVDSSQSVDRWSHEAVAGAFKHYFDLANTDIQKMRTAYNGLGNEYHIIGEKLSYPAKLDNLVAAEQHNSLTTSAIGDMATSEYKLNTTNVENNRQGSLFRVREALLHYMRDWSEEGASERGKIFGPILGVLKEVPEGERGRRNVLLPGSGLGRLAWDISELGYQATACEYSYYMIMALRYLLNPFKTTRPNQHTIQPWAHRFSHQRKTNPMFRTITFPDTLPRLSKRFDLIEGDFFNVNPPPKSNTTEGYDYIITLFFIDTSHNVAATLQHINKLLVPGGMWINLGPLLWTAAGTAGFELSLEEVLVLAQEMGFRVNHGGDADGKGNSLLAPRSIECEYTGDKEGMFKRLYSAEYFTATKVR